MARPLTAAFQLICAGGVLLLIGCAGSWKSVDPGMFDAYQGHAVEAVVMTDVGNVVFDSGAKLEGNVIRGYVQGKPVVIEFSEIRQVRFAEVTSSTSAYIVGGVLFAATAFVLFVMLFGYGGYAD